MFIQTLDNLHSLCSLQLVLEKSMIPKNMDVSSLNAYTLKWAIICDNMVSEILSEIDTALLTTRWKQASDLDLWRFLWFLADTHTITAVWVCTGNKAQGMKTNGLRAKVWTDSDRPVTWMNANRSEIDHWMIC